MAISWDAIRGIALFLGPILLPKAIAYYRSSRAASRHHGLSIQPVPRAVLIAIFLLFLLAFTLVVKTLPFLAPENVFVKTGSRLQIPAEVLFTRIAALRPDKELGEWDQALKAKFVNLESRLLYLQFGPEVLAECSFCHSEDPMTYFYYALPTLLWPHVANLIVLTTITSASWTGKYGSKWRTLATLAACILAVLELYLVNSYNHQANALALRLNELDFFHWSIRIYRLIALATLDVLLAFAIFLSSTNRAFVELPSPAERIELVSRVLLTAKSKLNAVGIVKNTAMRDEALRSRIQAYWQQEVRLMGEVMEDREVIEGINDALSNRVNIPSITKDADTYVQNVLQPLQR